MADLRSERCRRGARGDNPALLLGKGTAQDPPNRTIFNALGKIGTRIRLAGIEMDGEEESAPIIRLHTHPANSRLLKQAGGVATFDGADFLFGRHTSPYRSA